MGRVGRTDVAVAVLAVAILSGACTSPPDRPATVVATPAPAVVRGLAADLTGVWRATVNGAAEETLLTFGAGGVLVTSDPGYGMWRARPDGAEGTWVIPVAHLTITFVVVLRGESLIGSGVARAREEPGGTFHRISLVGSRLAIDPAALNAVTPPKPS